MNVILGLNFVF